MGLLALVAVLGYLLGSIPTAVIASRIVMHDDIRKYGSKNAGATNVFRVMGWKPALAVVLVDVLKGTAATLLIPAIGIGRVPLDPVMTKALAGTAAILGHVWTVFAGFKGGKGVGTAFGVLLGLAPVPVLITFVVWLALVLTTRIVSVGSLAAAVVLPVALILQRVYFKPEIPSGLLVLCGCLAVLIFVTHRSNIRRLLKGEENRFGSAKRPEGKP